MLERMKLVSRLGLMTIVSVIGLVVLGAVSLWTAHGQLVDAEIRRVEDVVTASGYVFEHFHELETKGVLSREEAQKQTLDVLRHLRFEGGNNYVFVYDGKGTTLLSPMKPDTEG